MSQRKLGVSARRKESLGKADSVAGGQMAENEVMKRGKNGQR